MNFNRYFVGKALGFITISCCFPLHATHPSTVCAALLSIAQKSLLESSNFAEAGRQTVNHLRGFRVDLGYRDVEPTYRELSLISERASENDLQKLAEQIRGIEKFMLQVDSDALDVQRRMVSFQLKGEQEINDFYLGLKQNQLQIDNFIANYPRFVLQKLNRAALSLFAIAALFLSHGPPHLLNSFGVDLISIPVILAAEPFALLRYALSRDERATTIQNKNLNFLAENRGLDLDAESNPEDSAPWVFNSWSYKVNQGLVDSLLDLPLSHVNSQDNIALQDLYDSRGILFRLFRPVNYLRFAAAGIPEETLERDRASEKKAWVYFDQLLSFDPETLQPVLSFVVRTSSKRKIFPESRPETEDVFTSDLSPDLVPNPVPVRAD